MTSLLRILLISTQRQSRMGEVYTRGRRDPDADRQVIAFVKVSHGIGAAFLRLVSPWQGRLHTEAGQFNVPRWRGHHSPDTLSIFDQIGAEEGWRWISEEQNWTWPGARNPDSVEGLASIGAINARMRNDKQLLGTENEPYDVLYDVPDHFIWDREAWYIAQLAWTLTCAVSPHAIVFGGRTVAVPGLLDKVRQQFAYIADRPSFPHYDEMNNLTTFLAKNSSGGPDGRLGRPGIRGALCLAAME